MYAFSWSRPSPWSMPHPWISTIWGQRSVDQSRARLWKRRSSRTLPFRLEAFPECSCNLGANLSARDRRKWNQILAVSDRSCEAALASGGKICSRAVQNRLEEVQEGDAALPRLRCYATGALAGAAWT